MTAEKKKKGLFIDISPFRELATRAVAPHSKRSGKWYENFAKGWFDKYVEEEEASGAENEFFACFRASWTRQALKDVAKALQELDSVLITAESVRLLIDPPESKKLYFESEETFRTAWAKIFATVARRVCVYGPPDGIAAVFQAKVGKDGPPFPAELDSLFRAFTQKHREEVYEAVASARKLQLTKLPGYTSEDLKSSFAGDSLTRLDG
jgi:hypothetical protein